MKKFRIVTLEGWLYRGNESFIKHSNFIRSYFNPINKYTNYINKFIKTIRKNHDLIIGVHIRRGALKDLKMNHVDDYLEFNDYMRMLPKLLDYFIKKKWVSFYAQMILFPKEFFLIIQYIIQMAT